jgi:hypothetical protein
MGTEVERVPDITDTSVEQDSHLGLLAPSAKAHTSLMSDETRECALTPSRALGISSTCRCATIASNNHFSRFTPDSSLVSTHSVAYAHRARSTLMVAQCGVCALLLELSPSRRDGPRSGPPRAKKCPIDADGAEERQGLMSSKYPLEWISFLRDNNGMVCQSA